MQDITRLVADRSLLFYRDHKLNTEAAVASMAYEIASLLDGASFSWPTAQEIEQALITPEILMRADLGTLTKLQDQHIRAFFMHVAVGTYARRPQSSDMWSKSSRAA